MEDTPSYKFYLSILAIVKNEAPYMQEWLDYHISMGVKHFYIYDNESDDNLHEVLTRYIEKGIVTYTFWPGKAQQRPAYNDALKKYKHDTRWLAVIDIDEFICTTNKVSLDSFLIEYEPYPALAIHWLLFDSNGYTYRQQGSVLENFTRVHKNYTLEAGNSHVKCIVNPLEVLKFSVHNHEYIDNKNAVNECFEMMIGNYGFDTIRMEKIRINHYYSKSKEEFLAKVDRGMATHVYEKRNIRKDDYDFTETTHDYTIWQHLKNKKNMFYRMKNLKLQQYKIITESNYFNVKWYIEQNPEINSELDAVKHYCEVGWKDGKNPSLTFNGNKYLEKNKDVKLADINPLLHYEMYGKKEGRHLLLESEID